MGKSKNLQIKTNFHYVSFKIASKQSDIVAMAYWRNYRKFSGKASAIANADSSDESSSGEVSDDDFEQSINLQVESES